MIHVPLSPIERRRAREPPSAMNAGGGPNSSRLLGVRGVGAANQQAERRRRATRHPASARVPRAPGPGTHRMSSRPM